MEHFDRPRKIDAHTHIGAFGSPFDIDFNVERQLQQMDAYNIGKTIICSSSAYSNEDTLDLLAERHPQLPIVMIHMGYAHGVYVDVAITIARRDDNICWKRRERP